MDTQSTYLYWNYSELQEKQWRKHKMLFLDSTSRNRLEINLHACSDKSCLHMWRKKPETFKDRAGLVRVSEVFTLCVFGTFLHGCGRWSRKTLSFFFCLSDQQGGTETPGRSPEETHTHTHSMSTRMSGSCVMKKKRHICTSQLCSLGGERDGDVQFASAAGGICLSCWQRLKLKQLRLVIYLVLHKSSSLGDTNSFSLLSPVFQSTF